MNENIKEVKFGPRVPDDLPGILRELADAAERGEVVAMVMAYERDGLIHMQQGCQLRDALILADVLHSGIMDKFRGR